MDFTFPILIFSFIVFLFINYSLSHDDYVFLRKGISMEYIFNSAFLTGFSCLFFARLIYVLSHLDKSYLNPLVFFLFIYFPGLSLTGGVIGALIFLSLYNKKVPKGRLFDFFSFSFLGASAIGFLFLKLMYLFTGKLKSYFEFSAPLIYLIFFILFLKLLFPLQRKGELKEGTLGFLTLSSFSVITFLVNLWSKKNRIFFVFGIEDIFLIILFIISILLINKQEKLLQRFTTKKGGSK